MITPDKLEIYARYKGDVDMFVGRDVRMRKLSCGTPIFDLIQVLLQDANVLDRTLGSPQRNAEAMSRLRSTAAAKTLWPKSGSRQQSYSNCLRSASPL